MNSLRWDLSVFATNSRHRLHYLSMAPRVFRNWWAWPLPKLGVSVVLELRNGLRYLVRTGTTDLGVLNEAVFLNPYLGPGHLKLPEDAVVIDIGANIGDFTIQVAALCPRGHVYAVEPISENARMILVNAALNGFTNVEVIHMALGSHEGEIEVHDQESCLTIYGNDRTTKLERVRLATLPELMRERRIERVDLLKMDCEGAEWDIVPAARECLPKIRQICMEFHTGRGWTAERLASWLHAAGYEVQHTCGAWNGLLWAVRSRS